MLELQKRLSEKCINFSIDRTSEEFEESVAICDEELMESYLEGNAINNSNIQTLIADR